VFPQLYPLQPNARERIVCGIFNISIKMERLVDVRLISKYGLKMGDALVLYVIYD
jgi:hypothetical protein